MSSLKLQLKDKKTFNQLLKLNKVKNYKQLNDNTYEYNYETKKTCVFLSVLNSYLLGNIAKKQIDKIIIPNESNTYTESIKNEICNKIMQDFKLTIPSFVLLELYLIDNETLNETIYGRFNLMKIEKEIEQEVNLQLLLLMEDCEAEEIFETLNIDGKNFDEIIIVPIDGISNNLGIIGRNEESIDMIQFDREIMSLSKLALETSTDTKSAFLLLIVEMFKVKKIKFSMQLKKYCKLILENFDDVEVEFLNDK